MTTRMLASQPLCFSALRLIQSSDADPSAQRRVATIDQFLPDSLLRTVLNFMTTPEASKAMLSRSTLTRGSPITPRTRPSIAASTRARTLSSGTPRALATAATCASAFSGEICGSSPEAEVVTASAGIGPVAAGRALRLDVGLHAIEQLLRGRAEIRAGRIGGVIGRVDRLGGIVGMRGILRLRRRGTAVEIFVGREVLTDQRRADRLAGAFGDQAAIGLVGQDDLRDRR